MTIYLLIAILVVIALFIGRMILNHKAEQDTRARLNYERHKYERERQLLNTQMSDTQRAGHRRAGEYSWGREGEGA